MDILALLKPIEDSLSKTTLRQMSRVILAMLAMTGRVTMLGLSRWAGKGGSYRTHPTLLLYGDPVGASVLAVLSASTCFRKRSVYMLAGDESVVSKAGKKTYGLDHFFSGIQQKGHSKPVLLCGLPGRAFSQRCSYPLCVEQTVRSQEEKSSQQSQERSEKSQIQLSRKRKPGRPKGSKNKNKSGQ